MTRTFDRRIVNPVRGDRYKFMFKEVEYGYRKNHRQSDNESGICHIDRKTECGEIHTDESVDRTKNCDYVKKASDY